MSFAGLYELNDYEIANLYKEMAENFYEDELYKTVFPYKKSDAASSAKKAPGKVFL